MKILLILVAIGMAGYGAFHHYTVRDQYIEAAMLSEAFVLATPVRTAMMDYHLRKGVLPRSNAAVGLPEPTAIFGSSVKRVGILPGGALQVDFDDVVGARTLTFSPIVSVDGGVLTWRCTSNSIDQSILDKVVPRCIHEQWSLESKLMDAVANTSMAQVEALLQQGANPNEVVHNSTPLMLSAQMGQVEIVAQLIAGGANVNGYSSASNRVTPLMLAINGNHAATVDVLLHHSASVRGVDAEGKNALAYALQKDADMGTQRYVPAIVSQSHKQSTGDPVGLAAAVPNDTPQRLSHLYGELRQNAAQCRTQRVGTLLKQAGDTIDAQLADAKLLRLQVSNAVCAELLIDFVESRMVYLKALQAHLHAATRQCDVAEVQRVLRDNPNVDPFRHVPKSGPVVSQAALMGCAELVAALVPNNIDSDRIEPGLLSSVIQRAPRASVPSIVETLINAGVNLNVSFERIDTPLGAAIAAEFPALAEQLMDAGAKVNVATINASYPLIEATKKDLQPLVRRMIDENANIDAKDTLGRNAIMAAVAQGNQPLVELLMSVGANPYAPDNSGLDAATLSSRQGQAAIRGVLKNFSQS